MGSFGSRRKRGKDCTDDMRQIDVRRLERYGYLRAGMVYGWQWTQCGDVVASINATVETEQVWFAYRLRECGGQWQDIRYPVKLDRTVCHLGGARVWWRCPATGCGRRVAILYGGALFFCRHCQKLAYQSQRETSNDRQIRRVEKIRRYLKWEPGFLDGDESRPKWMRRRKYLQLLHSYDSALQKALLGISIRFKLDG